MSTKTLKKRHDYAAVLLKGVEKYSLLVIGIDRQIEREREKPYTESFLLSSESELLQDQVELNKNLNWFVKRYKNLIQEMNLITVLNEIEKESYHGKRKTFNASK